MRDAVAHRGPDDATIEIVDDWAGLGFQRLSILDLEGSRQPLRSERGDIVVVFNGEIYNYVELRARLKSLGHVFATHGDGEVIVHGYEQWGDEVVTKLEGMFAFVIVDRTRRRALVARDRFGIKPLFTHFASGVLLVASEIKALLQHPDVSRAAGKTALDIGCLRSHIPWPYTAFRSVRRLPPGTALVFDGNGIRSLSRYAPLVEPPTLGEEPTVEETLEVLKRAVARQMVADVPVGAFLSGGVDSTLITALMVGMSSHDIHTFSIKTNGDDESQEARATAAQLGTVHQTIALDELNFDSLSALPAMFDEPYAETSALGVSLLSAAAKKHVTVALSGDGGDEVFAGYQTYRAVDLMARSKAFAPDFAVTALSTIADEALRNSRWPGPLRKSLRLLAALSASPGRAQRLFSLLAWEANDKVSETLSLRIAAAGLPRNADATPLRAAMAADRAERLPNAMLTKVDIASMAASLEVRVPLLDDSVVRLSARIGSRSLATPRHGKVLLRKALAEVLPGSRAWAKKRGFTLPVDKWLRQPETRRKFSSLLHDHSRLLRHLTGVNISQLWSEFDRGTSHSSAGTAAVLLLWYATVALWATRFGVTETEGDALGGEELA